VVSADCLEFKVRRAQAHPFLQPGHIGAVGIVVDNCPG